MAQQQIPLLLSLISLLHFSLWVYERSVSREVLPPFSGPLLENCLGLAHHPTEIGPSADRDALTSKTEVPFHSRMIFPLRFSLWV
mmetsp:Transcript_40440/g.65603  ORF Transcript_40440/g.65603 Transcript_40440/m.65603 type:complete len:85 (+) Transcript_40440:379-633(+)